MKPFPSGWLFLHHQNTHLVFYYNEVINLTIKNTGNLIKPYFETPNGKLYCGDSLKLLPQIPKESIPFVITDPPFNCLTNWGVKEGSVGKRLTHDGWFANDCLSDEDFKVFISTAFSQIYDVLVSGGGSLIFCDYKIYPLFYNTLQEAGFNIKNVLIWDKIHFGLGQNWRYVYEMIIFATKGDNYNFYSKKDQSNILREQRLINTIHPTEKPVNLLKKLVSSVSQEGDVILDPFAGSGSTLVAADELQRKWLGIELSEEYCRKIQNRLSQTRLFDYVAPTLDSFMQVLKMGD